MKTDPRTSHLAVWLTRLEAQIAALPAPLAAALLPVSFVVIAFLIFWPYIGSGFALDDFFWISIFEEHMPFRRWVGLWDVDATQFRAFQNLWWTDATQDIGRFWRPVFSLVMEGTYRAMGRAGAAPLHGLAILLHALVAFTACRMLSLVTRERIISLTAALLYLVSEDHSMTVGWISTSTDLFAVLFMNLTVILYIKHRATGRPGPPWLALASMVMALGGKETAVVTPIAIVLYEVLAEPGASLRRRVVRLREAAPGWGSSIILAGAFLVAYRAMGFGARSLAYYDPLKNPGDYLAHAAQGMGILLLGWLTPAPIGLTLFVPAAVLPAALVGWALFALVIFALWPLRREPGVQWSLLLFFAASLPQLSADASERQLYYPMIPGAYLLARMIFCWPALARRYSNDTADPGRLRGQILPATLMLSAGLLATGMSLYYPFMYRASLTSTQERAKSARSLIPADAKGPIIFLNAPDPFFPMYVSDVLRFQEGRYLDVYPLSGFYGRIEARSTGTDSFSLRTDSPGWLSNMFARIPRQARTIAHRYERSPFVATPARTVTLPDGVEDVLEVKFQLGPDQAATILYFDGQHWNNWPGPKGPGSDWHLLADTGDVMKAMQ